MFNKIKCVLGLAAVCGLASLGWGSGVAGSGKMTTETRAVAGAHGVELSSIGSLVIAQGDKEELVIEAEDNLVPLIESNVNKDGVLLLRFKENVRTTKKVTYKLTVKNMDQIILSGSGSIESDHLTADHANIRLPGSGDIRIAQLDAGDVTVKLSGSGNIALRGGARAQAISVSGSGKYSAGGFKSDTAEVSISGSGEVRLHAKDTLDVKISGSGEVAYSGDPTVTKKISGSGEINKL